jgi:hypothetical protein
VSGGGAVIVVVRRPPNSPDTKIYRRHVGGFLVDELNISMLAAMQAATANPLKVSGENVVNASPDAMPPLPGAVGSSDPWRIRATQTWPILASATICFALGTLAAVIGPASASVERSTACTAPKWLDCVGLRHALS